MAVRRVALSLPLLLPALAAQKPGARFPDCPSPPELSPERDFLLLRKHFRGAWIPSDRPEPPAGAARTFDDAAWIATEVPGLAAGLVAARKPRHRLALRRLFEATASPRSYATLVLPPIDGTVSAWLDGRPLLVPPQRAASQEVEIGELSAPGIHLLYLEVSPAGNDGDPIAGEVFVTRSDAVRIARLHASAPPPAAKRDTALVTASVSVRGAAPRDAVFELWRLGGNTLSLMDRRARECAATMHVPFRIDEPRLWTPAVPSLYVLRAALLEEGRPADGLGAPVPLRGYAVTPEGLFVRGEREPLLAVRASFAPGPNLPDRAAVELRRWKALGANAVVLTGSVPPAIAWLTDRIGLLALAAPVERDAGPSLGRAVELLEEDFGAHPSFAGFVVPATSQAPRTTLAVLTERAPPRTATDTRPRPAIGPWLLSLDSVGEDSMLAAWREARERGASGVVVPPTSARVLSSLRAE